MPAGRPTKYKPEYIQQAITACELLGADDVQLGKLFAINNSTLYDWKTKFPEFAEAIREAKARYDVAVVEAALKHRAVGYSHPETKVNVIDGQIVTTDVIKHYPPETAAATLLLTNRDPDRWKSRRQVDHAGHDGGALDFAGVLAALTGEETETD